MEGIYAFLAYYERKTAEVYEKILPSVKNSAARLLISILAIDSRKHSEVFRHLSGERSQKGLPRRMPVPSQRRRSKF